MANREELDSSDAVVLTHALEKLRARDGLVLERLQTTTRKSDVAPLLRLPLVQNFAALQDIDPALAALQVVAQCVRDTTDGTHQIVADAILGLGVLEDAYSLYGLDNRVTQALRADSLGRRRSTLLRNWRTLHLAMGLPTHHAPSDRTLRGTLETEVLRQLARQLLNPGDQQIVVPTIADAAKTSRNAQLSPAGRVIVIGGAVMDVIFRTNVIPQHETSTRADQCLMTPGGKGVSQAVAAARLGLRVSLIAALGDDSFGQEIVEYLRTENVDTSLLKIVRGARTPVTGVFELPLGDSIAAFWRNDKVISLGVRDVDLLGHQISDCDTVLLSFEIPRETFQRAVDLAHPDSQQRPTVIVTPGQPYSDGLVSRQALSQIDFLVAHTWEIARYGSQGHDRFDPHRIGEDLLRLGVGTVCLLGNGGGLIYSRITPDIQRLPTVSSPFKESSITRDAFCAALAAKLIDEGELSEKVAAWTTAAMACAAEDHKHSTTMPDRERIERKLRNHNTR
ncbi:PfkB family carbohydrate kinase [Kribbella sp. CA-293567]|uniref:PfkB family carbohydrate kinase n=1 Tax=Kribbella sp. CA-293567 TaxID=3002436 RepID=UPI0022DDB1DF|nr:PfkB family carbohydrate kinase [Kribbella sp. CA-293567]WBQ02294.1 PfkB family carbohydrate kinase [Kribbella sp. CA-293567]